MSDRSGRVARVITRLNIGGPAIQAIELSRQLAASGFQTCLIHGHLAEGEGDMRTLMPIREVEAVYVDDLVRPVSPIQDVRALWTIFRALRRWRPRIVHTHMAKAGTLGRLAALAYNRTQTRARRARLIHTYHGHVFEGYFGSRSARAVVAVERWLARRTDVLIAISGEVKKDLLETFDVAREEQIRLIPLGFDLERLLEIGPEQRRAARTALDLPSDAIVVATVGRLTAIKQHALFLQMASRLVRQSDRYVFVVVGDGELRGDLEAQAAALGLAARVRFLGWRGDLATIYGATDIFTLTSRNEGTPVALIEAMAAGVAAVSTDVGGVRDVISSAGIGVLVPFGDPEALAHAVQGLADDSQLRAAIGTAAREAVRGQFAMSRLVHDISGLYRELLRDPAQR